VDTVDIQDPDSNVGTTEVPLATKELQEALGHTAGGDRYSPPCSLFLHGPCSQKQEHRVATGSLQLSLGPWLAWDTLHSAEVKFSRFLPFL